VCILAGEHKDDDEPTTESNPRKARSTHDRHGRTGFSIWLSSILDSSASSRTHLSISLASLFFLRIRFLRLRLPPPLGALVTVGAPPLRLNPGMSSSQTSLLLPELGGIGKQKHPPGARPSRQPPTSTVSSTPSGTTSWRLRDAWELQLCAHKFLLPLLPVATGIPRDCFSGSFRSP
jgi:hypothetical protein